MVSDDKALAAAIGKRAPKTKRGRLMLQKREPKPVEDAKTALIITGNRSSHDVQTFLRDLHRVRSPLSTLFTQKHAWHPFEDISRLESICVKYDHGLFAFGSSSKKRPFRLILGRLFDSHLLDMQEFSVKDYKTVQSFGSKDALLGAKPLVIFQGTAFDTDERMKRAKSLLLDFFSGPKPEKVMLQGLEHVIVCSAFDTVGASGTAASSTAPSLSVRRFAVKLEKSGSRLPRVELREVGPRFTLEIDRTKDPEREHWKQAIKVPKEVKPKKVKNVSSDSMGKKRGRVHLGKQDFDKIVTVHHGEAKRKKLRQDLSAAKSGAGE